MSVREQKKPPGPSPTAIVVVLELPVQLISSENYKPEIQQNLRIKVHFKA